MSGWQLAPNKLTIINELLKLHGKLGYGSREWSYTQVRSNQYENMAPYYRIVVDSCRMALSGFNLGFLRLITVSNQLKQVAFGLRIVLRLFMLDKWEVCFSLSLSLSGTSFLICSVIYYLELLRARLVVENATLYQGKLFMFCAYDLFNCLLVG